MDLALTLTYREGIDHDRNGWIDQTKMNKYVAIILMTVSILPFGNPAFADFEKALDAYESGDYISALKFYKKAAEQSEGDTTLISAVLNGHDYIIALLISDYADLDHQNQYGDNALILAIDNGEIDIARILISNGADVDLQNNAGDTALISASLNGHSDIARLLIIRGADLNFQNSTGDSALTYAVRGNHRKIAKVLINKGADLNLRNKYDSNALIYAIKNGQKDIVKLLIENGADIRFQNYDQTIALAPPLSKDQEDIVKLLIDNGANLIVQSDTGDIVSTSQVEKKLEAILSDDWPTWYSVTSELPEVKSKPHLSPAEIYETAKENIWIIVAGRSLLDFVQLRELSQGSAVAISSNDLLTTCHVVEDRPLVAIVQGETIIEARLTSADPSTDRCILTVSKPQLLPVHGVRRFSDMKVGERVYTIGAPSGFERTLGEGLISGLRTTEEGKLIQTTAPISPGSSGGGLFDSSGHLIGVTSFLLTDAQSLNFAIVAEDFWR